MQCGGKLKPKEAGTLYVVATPIGNREDLSPRAMEILRSVSLIVSESYGETKKLCLHHSIATEIKALYKDQSDDPYSFLRKGLASGLSYALVSDAGSPGVSDPGSALVRFAREWGSQISPIPGPSALTSLLSVSGFQTNPTLFLGFLSETPGKKRKELSSALGFEGLLVFFESVHKLPKLYPLLSELFPGVPVLVGRELTKTHEEVRYYASPADLEADPPLAKGEFAFLLNLRKKTLKGFSESTDS